MRRGGPRLTWRSFRICSSTNAALKSARRIIKYDLSGQGRAAIPAPQPAAQARSPNSKRVAYSAWGSFLATLPLNFHHIEKAPDERRGAADAANIAKLPELLRQREN